MSMLTTQLTATRPRKDQLMTEPLGEFMTVAEIAAILKLNQQTVRNWIAQGSLPAVHVGRRVRVRRSDFEALLENSQTVPRHSSAETAPTDELVRTSIWDGEIPRSPRLA
jgi:excisionase family DNA binding protein